MTESRRGDHRAVLLVILLTAALATSAASAQADPGTPPDSVARALVAVQDSLAPHREASQAEAWIARLTAALEAPRGASPAAHVVARLHFWGDAPEVQIAEPALRARALEQKADAIVFARLARLGSHASLDLRVLSAATGNALARHVLPVEHPSRLAAVADQASQLVRASIERWEALAHAAPVLADADDPGQAAAAVAPDAEDLRVAEVAVVGNHRVDTDAVRAAALTQRGSAYSPAHIARDVRRIHALGFFRDVQAFAEPTLDGIRVEFVVEEHPVVRRVTLSGNESVSSDVVTERMTLAAGTTIDYPLLIENQDRIAGFYQTRGYYTAQVRYEVDPIDEHSVAVNFDVREGPMLRLREVVFQGNDHMDDADLMQGFQTKPWGLLSFVTQYWDSSGMYAEPLFYQDLDLVRRRYLDAGFIRARLGDPQVEIADDGLRVRVDIDEGPQFKVGGIDVRGDASMDHAQLMELVQLAPGQIFSRSTLSDDVERLRRHYADLGYFKADVRPLTRVDPETLSVDCVLEVEKGELFFVERVEIGGNTKTRDHVVRRELSVVEGELYSSDALVRSRARLRRLGFFEEVNIESRPLDAGRVAVEVGVVERPTGTFSFGVGFGTTEGFLLNGAMRQENLFGRGYGLDLEADLGTRNQRGKLHFTYPFFLGTPASLGTGLNFSTIEFGDFDQTVSRLSLDVSYPLDEGETRVGTGYAYSDRSIDSEFNRGVASLIQREEFGGRSTTSQLSFSRRVDTRDDPRNTRSGQINQLGFEVAGLGGVSQFLRFEIRSTRYTPIPLFGLDSTFVFHTRAGYTLPLNSVSDFDLDTCVTADCMATLAMDGSLRQLSTIDDDLELPLSERYILGGVSAFQVRGYETRSLGPRRARLRPVRRDDGGVLFQAINTNPVCDGPERASLPDDACNDFDDTDPDDFADLDLTDVIGGSRMFLANFELRVPISEDLGITGIAFFDMGNAWAESDALDPRDIRFGTGLGAEWLSPFGPIGVYLGLPLNPLEDEKSSVFEFSLGGTSF